MQLLSDCLPDYGTEQSWGGYQFMPCILVSSVPSSMTEPWEQLLSGIVGRLDELLNSSLSSFPCLGCLKLSLNFIIFPHTQLLDPYR